MGARKLSSTTLFQPVASIVKSSSRKLKISNAKYKPYPIGLPSLATDLIKSYFLKGLTEQAHKLFNEMSYRDLVVWTAMISGYTSCYQHYHAWTMFCDVLKNGVEPTFTISSILKACKNMKSLLHVTSILGLAIKIGTTKGSIVVGNALMDMYGAFDRMDKTSMVFEDIKKKNDVSWTTMIAGYTHRGDAYSGLQLFCQMFLEEAKP